MRGLRLAWADAVVAELQASRKAGVQSFASAWEFALMLHPPHHSPVMEEQMTLLDQPEETFEEFHKRACLRAWRGTGPDLSPELVSEAFAMPARSKSRSAPQ